MIAPGTSEGVTPGELWTGSANNDVKEVDVSGDGITAAAASADGNIYVIGREGKKSTHPVTSGSEATTVAVSRDHTRIIGGDSDGSLFLLAGNGSEIATRAGVNSIYSADISQNGSSVAMSDSGGLNYFDTSSDSFVISWGRVKANYEVDISDTGDRVLAYDTQSTNGELVMYDGGGNSLGSWQEPNGADINVADLSEDGSQIAVTTSNNRIYLFNAATAVPTWNATLPGKLNSVSISGSGEKIVTRCEGDGNIYVYDSISGSLLTQWKGGTDVRISYDGEYITALSSGVELYNNTGSLVWQHPVDVGDYYLGRSCAISDDGSHIIRADATTNYNIYYLTSIPETTISYDDSYTSGGTLYVSEQTTFTLSADCLAPDNTSYWRVDSESYRTYSGPFELSAYEEGNHTLYYYTEDSYGNAEAPNTLDFYLDKEVTSLSITSPANDSWMGASFTVEWNGSDSGVGIQEYQLRTDEGAWKDLEMNTSYLLGPLDDGQHTIDVRAFDHLSHSKEASVVVNVDDTPPTLDISSPTEGEYLFSSDVMVSWSGSDAGSGIDHYEARLDGGSWVNKGTDISHEFTDVPDGGHNVQVKAVDAIDNTATESVDFNVDTSDPSISINTPSENMNISQNSVTLEWNATDSGSGVDRFEIRADDGNWMDIGDHTSHELDGLSNGSHTVDVKAIDAAGNIDIDTVNFTVDTMSPMISIHTPSADEILEKKDVNINWTGDDEHSGIQYYEIRIDDGAWKDVGDKTSYTFEDLSAGEHSVMVKAVDNAGNERVETVGFETKETSDDEGGFSPDSAQDYWWVILVLIIVAVIAVLMLKRRTQEEVDTESFDRSETEGTDNIETEDETSFDESFDDEL